MAENRQPRIVVGVDGSEPSLAALRWALAQAELIGAIVQVVSAWDYPVAAAWTPISDVGDLERDCRETLCRAVVATIGTSMVPVQRLVVRGHPAAMLLKAARGADLLVVGCRGHSGFVGSLLGSVSRYCVQHASCPVMVVRTPHADTHRAVAS